MREESGPAGLRLLTIMSEQGDVCVHTGARTRAGVRRPSLSSISSSPNCTCAWELPTAIEPLGPVGRSAGCTVTISAVGLLLGRDRTPCLRLLRAGKRAWSAPGVAGLPSPFSGLPSPFSGLPSPLSWLPGPLGWANGDRVRALPGGEYRSGDGS